MLIAPPRFTNTNKNIIEFNVRDLKIKMGGNGCSNIETKIPKPHFDCQKDQNICL